MSRLFPLLVLFHFVFIPSVFSQKIDFNKVVIWGHKLHSHTHSYIHDSFYRAFHHLGYKTYWFDDKAPPSDFDFSKALFITEGQADYHIPLREDCFYILHNCSPEKYLFLQQKKRTMIIQVYTNDVLSRPHLLKVEPCTYFDVKGRTLYFMWGTDLLPNEIEKSKSSVFATRQKKQIAWIGTIWDGEYGNISELQPFIDEGRKHGYQFLQKTKVSNELNKNLIQNSALAPAIVGSWQKKQGYIPCRIFKNISYGQMGITNSSLVNEVFEGKLIYNPDTQELFKDSLRFLETKNKQAILDLMDFVKEKHTYLNRIQTILTFIDHLEDN